MKRLFLEALTIWKQNMYTVISPSFVFIVIMQCKSEIHQGQLIILISIKCQLSHQLLHLYFTSFWWRILQPILGKVYKPHTICMIILCCPAYLLMIPVPGIMCYKGLFMHKHTGLYGFEVANYELICHGFQNIFLGSNCVSMCVCVCISRQLCILIMNGINEKITCESWMLLSMFSCIFWHKVKKHYTYAFAMSQNRHPTVAFQVGCGLSGGDLILTVAFEWVTDLIAKDTNPLREARQAAASVCQAPLGFRDSPVRDTRSGRSALVFLARILFSLFFTHS